MGWELVRPNCFSEGSGVQGNPKDRDKGWAGNKDKTTFYDGIVMQIWSIIKQEKPTTKFYYL